MFLQRFYDIINKNETYKNSLLNPLGMKTKTGKIRKNSEIYVLILVFDIDHNLRACLSCTIKFVTLEKSLC